MAVGRDGQNLIRGRAHVDPCLQGLGGEICLILLPPERICRRLSQAVASRGTLRNRKVINIRSAYDNQNREPHKDLQQRQ